MNSRASIYVLMIASVVCLLTVLVLTSQLNSARVKLHRFEPGAFNYVLQADSNLDKFRAAIDHYQTAYPSSKRDSVWEELGLRYDLLWGAFSVFKIPAPGKEREIEGTTELRSSAQEFLDQYESFFEFKSPLKIDEKTYETVVSKVSELQRGIHRVGTRYFVASSDFGEDLSNRINHLYVYLTTSGFLMLLTAVLLIIQLFRFFNRADRLRVQAEQSESKLSLALEDVRSGRREIRARDNFLAAASHDLRQPLHALGLFIGSLESKLHDKSSLEILSKIKLSTAALTQMFGGMLDLSKLDAGVVSVNRVHFDLDNILDTLRQELNETAQQNDMDFIVDSNGICAYTDPVLLVRVLRNLAENALAHSSSDVMGIACIVSGGNVLIEIYDRGVGIPEGEQESIFTEYYQLGNPERDRSKGLGLGLSIVYRLCRLLDISLELKSGLNQGTTFKLEVPLGDRQKIKNTQLVDKPVGVSSLKGASILVIEDERDVREGMQLILADYQCEVHVAESAAEAIELINEKDVNPDLMIVDYRLREGKTGTEAIDMIREELNQNIKSIIVTGDTSPDRVLEIAESGILLLHKPVTPEKLISALVELPEPA